MILRPATRDDVIAMYGKPFDQTMRAFTAEHDGKVYGVAGVLHGQPLQGFSSMIDEMAKYPMTIRRAIRMFRGIMRNYHAPIYACASGAYQNSCRILELAGFQKFDERIYVWTPQH